MILSITAFILTSTLPTECGDAWGCYGIKEKQIYINTITPMSERRYVYQHELGHSTFFELKPYQRKIWESQMNKNPYCSTEYGYSLPDGTECFAEVYAEITTTKENNKNKPKLDSFQWKFVKNLLTRRTK